MSDFMIGATLVGLTALDELTVPVPDPQQEFSEFVSVERLGDLSTRGFGPSVVTWEFQLASVAEIGQLRDLRSSEPLYIQTPNVDDEFTVYLAQMNWTEPKQDGAHKPGFKGWRFQLRIEFVILEAVEAS